MNVGEAIARTLIDEGVDAVFSLLGDGTVRIVYHLARLGVPVYEGRHEAYVYAMADGYARATGRPTVCAITGGPALGHTLTAMTSAARTRAPVLLLTGPADRDDLSGRQRLDHRAMTELSGAAYFPIHSGGVSVRRVREVFDKLYSDPGPAVLDVPEVAQVENFEGRLTPRSTPHFVRPQRQYPDPAVLDQAVEMFEHAERPVLIAGAGAVASGARTEISALAHHCGALLATTINARGYFEGEEFAAGISGGYASQPGEALFRQADLVVSFGSSMDRFVTRGGALFPNARFIQVDSAPPGPMATGISAECYLRADARAAATALTERLTRAPTRVGYRTSEVAAALESPSDPWEVQIEDGRVDPRDLCARLDDLLPAECGWVSGNSGHFWAFPIMHMNRWRVPLLHASGFGAIGYGLAVGVGAAIAAEGKPVVAFEGDAGAVMHIQAIETAARYHLPLLVVVLNDGALGAEYHGMVAEGYEPDLSLTPNLDIAGVARSLGARAATLTDLGDLAEVVANFLEGEGPMLIDARISRRVISRPFRRVTYHFTV